MEAPLSPPLRAPQRGPQRPKAPSGWPGIPIGRVLGLDIRIDISWLLIFALVSLSLFDYFSQKFPNVPVGALWTSALLTSVLFFGGVLLHEISHSVVAKAKGIEVSGITLFMFGGVSQIRQEPRRPSDEFSIALIGPVASAVLGILFSVIAHLLAPDSVSHFAAAWLGRINIALAIFNLLPGFPLDGGRMLRAAVWGATKDLRRATRVATFMGSAIAFGLVGWGILDVLWGGRFVEGLWFGLIGWFLLVGSRQSQGQMELKETLGRLRVEQAMRSSCPQVPADLTLESFVDEYVFHRGGKCFFVIEGHLLRGLVTLDDVRRMNREQWSRATVGDIMTPLSDIKSISPKDSLLAAFERMNEHSLNQLPVVDGDHVQGVITRNDIFRLVAKYLELTERPHGA